MNAEYKKEAEKSYLVLAAEEAEHEFSTEMLLENKIQGILSLEKRSFNGEIIFYYDITGKKSLKSHIQKEPLREQEIRIILQKVYCTIGELYNYFLDAKGLIIDTEYIFAEKEDYFFCYYPSEKQELIEEKAAGFAEQLTEAVDYEDEAAVQMVFQLYKKLKEEDKGILRVLEEVLTQETMQYQEEEDMVYHFEPESDEEEKKEQKKFFDWISVVCFSLTILVSLCYLGIMHFKTNIVAYLLIFTSIPGIVMGFVDIEKKK